MQPSFFGSALATTLNKPQTAPAQTPIIPGFQLTPSPVAAISSSGGGNASTIPSLIGSPQPIPQQAGLSLGATPYSIPGLSIDSVGSTPLPRPAPVYTSSPISVSSSPSIQAGYSAPVTGGQNFIGTSSGNTYDSSKLSPGAIQDLLDARRAKEKAMLSGMNPDGTPNTNLFPTDTLQGQLANALYQSKLYTPEEQSLIANGQDLTAQISAKKLAERRRVTALQENGTITKEQGKAFIEEADRRANQELADLAVQQEANTAQLTAAGLIRQNQVASLQGIVDLAKPTEVAPGSTLVNPLSGTSVFQGQGASPATIISTAQTLKQNDQITGNIHLTPNGQVDDNYYYQQAQQLFATGGTGGVGGASSSVSGGVSTGVIPQQVQTYLQSSGGDYINDSRVPTAQKDLVKQLAAQSGVPYLDAGDVASVQAIDYTKTQTAKLGQIVNQILFDGAGGKLANIATAKINQLFPTSEARTAFSAARETAIKQIQSLVAGSGSGFRLTQPEIEQAVGQLPLETDSLSVANAKLSWINSFLDTKKNLALYGTVGPQTPPPGSKSQSSDSGNVIQTAVGAVDNNWF